MLWVDLNASSTMKQFSEINKITVRDIEWSIYTVYVHMCVGIYVYECKKSKVNKY